MNNKNKKLGNLGRRFLMSTIGGKRRYQKFFGTLFLISCHGMNFGELSNFKNNGENLVLNYIKNKSKNSPVVIFDVGANQGEYSSFVLDVFKGEKLNLFSFEPSPTAFKLLKKSNGNKSNSVNIGFSDKKKKSILFSWLKGSTLSSIYKRNLKEYDINMNLKEIIHLDTIDNFCYRNKIKKIDFLKIDVEGHELNVLKGAKKMINSGLINYIQFETGCNVDSRTYFRDFFYLLTPKYKIYRILKDGFFPLNKYGWENEIAVGANYFCIKNKKDSPLKN